MLVVVFDNETKAFEGKSALKELDRDGSLALYASAVILKHADGSVSVKDEHYAPPFGALTATPIGSVIGLLGGPAGFAAGTFAGLLVGGLVDFDNARVGEDYVDDVSRSLTPNKVALVAEVDEEWTTPVDTRMDALGGIIFRRALWEVRDKADDNETAAMKADLAQLKAEIQSGNAEVKKKLQAKVDALQAKIEAREQTLKQRFAARQAQARAKAEVLHKNAAAAGRALKELATTPV
jgi:uncharacterized membrane protein